MIVEDTSLEITVPKKIDEISSVSEDMTTVLSFFVIKCYLTNDGFTREGLRNAPGQNKVILDEHNTELQRADPGTEVMGQFSTRGHIFPHDTMPKMGFHYSHRFS